MDFDRFWKENALCLARPFSTDKPRAGLTIGLDDHWLFGEMAPVSTLRCYADPDYRLDLCKRCNDRVEKGIGLRPFVERPSPPPPRIEMLFGCRFEYTEGSTPWLVPGAEGEKGKKSEKGVKDEKSVKAFERVLDRAEGTSLMEFFLPAEFQRGWEENGGGRLGGGSRGPATIGTCVCGTEQYLTWLIDEPEMMERFHRLLGYAIVERDRILREFSGNTSAGFGFLDDNCCLLSPALYERFCLPVLDAVFSAFSPDASDRRFQHSDSAMGHLMPLLRRVGLNGANFGPEVAIEQIRRELPNAMIYGQIPPFLLMRGTREEIEQCVKHDFEIAGRTGHLVVTTSGSVSCGTSIERLRWLMEIVDEHTRYD